MKQLTFVFCVASILVSGCSLDDDERCPKGYSYASQSRTCFKDEDLSTDETDKDENSTDLDEMDASFDNADGGETDEPVDVRPSGIGESCTTSSECAQYREEFCFYSERLKTGYCTIKECGFGECPTGYMCCDCTTSVLFPAEYFICMNEEQANLAVSAAGCTCE